MPLPRYRSDAARDFGGGGHPGGRDAVGVAVVKEDMGLEGPQHLVLGHATQEKHLINPYLPGAQCQRSFKNGPIVVIKKCTTAWTDKGGREKSNRPVQRAIPAADPAF